MSAIFTDLMTVLGIITLSVIMTGLLKLAIEVSMKEEKRNEQN